MRDRLSTTRRDAIAGIAAVLPLLAGTTRAGAQTLTPLRIGTQPVDTSALIYYAERQGFFKQAGFDAQLTVTNNGAEIVSALAGGSLDIGHSNVVTLFQIHEKKLPFVIISPGGSYHSENPTTGLIVKKTSPIQTAKDLNGKIVGTNGIANITQVGVSSWIDKNGGDYKSIKWTEIAFPLIPAAIENGRLEASIAPEPMFTEAMESGNVRNLGMPYDGIGSRWLISASFAGTAWTAAHPDLVKRFNAVMETAAKWANAHRADTAKFLEDLTKTPVNPRTHRVLYSEQLQLAELQPVIDASARYGALQSAFPAAELIAPGLTVR